MTAVAPRLPSATEGLRTVSVLVAGDKEENLDGWLSTEALRALREAGAVERRRVARVGFVWLPDRLVVVLPKAYASHRARRRLQDPAFALARAFLLIRLLGRCRRDPRFRALDPGREPLIERGLPADPNQSTALEAAVALRADYVQHGLYWEKSARPRRNDPSNPIDWSRTTRSHPPLLGESEVIWFDTVHRGRTRDAFNLVHRLHARCVCEVLALTGEGQLAPETPPLTSAEEAALHASPGRLIGDLLGRTYRDRGRHVLRLMGTWFEGTPLAVSPGRRTEPVLLLSRSFEQVWEHVLRDLLDEDPSRSRALSAGVWVPIPSPEKALPVREGIRPEIDILRKTGEAGLVFLLDAKDKQLRFDRPSGTPADHYKQAVYAQLLDLPEGTELVNALLFPVAGISRPVRVVGVHHWPEVVRSRVVEAGVDYELAVHSWLGDCPFSADEFAIALREQAQTARQTPYV